MNFSHQNRDFTVDGAFQIGNAQPAGNFRTRHMSSLDQSPLYGHNITLDNAALLHKIEFEAPAKLPLVMSV